MFGENLNARLVRVALGEIPADLVVKDVRLVNVNTGEIEPNLDIAVKDGKIALVGNADHCVGNGTEVINAKDQYLIPGLLDAHVHVESSMLTLTQFARVVLPRGTTGVFIDSHEIANVLGLRGIELLIRESRKIPLKVFVGVPPCVPSAPGLETTGAEFGPKEVVRALRLEKTTGLGEVMSFSSVLAGDEKIFRKITAAKEAGKTVEGHAPGLIGKELAAYISAGIVSDHESSTGREAIERLRRGVKLEIREGSIAKNLSALIKPILERGLDTRHCLLATDDRDPRDLLREGHIDHVVRRAMEEGVDPVRAIQMATINTAKHFGVSDLGDLSPGRVADMIVVRDLQKFKANTVFVNGTLVARAGKLLIQLPSFVYPKFVTESVRLRRKLTAQDFVVKSDRPSGKVKVRIIAIREGEIAMKHETAKLEVKNGGLSPDPTQNIAQVAVVERHRKTGNIGLGFVKGFGVKKGALASSVGHDAHNIVVVGMDPADMARAVNEIARMRGGLVTVLKGETVAGLELPIAGLMSDRPAEEVSGRLGRLHLAAKRLGVRLESPFMVMGFLPLAVIPELRITDKGLVDVEKSELVELVVKSENKPRGS
jgi:adenine deaminase